MAVDKNPQKIKKLFNEISVYYDFMNNVISFWSHYLFKYLAIKDLNIKDSMKVLDLACGSGDIVKIITKLSKKSIVKGLDISDKMLKIAKRKNPKAEFIQGDIINLPFGDNEFDYITIAFGLRNIENRAKAISEIYRTTKQGGLFFHMDFGEDNFLSKIFDFFIPIIAGIVVKNKADYTYLIKSKNEYPKPDNLIEEFKNVGFKLVRKKYFLFKTISYQIMEK